MVIWHIYSEQRNVETVNWNIVDTINIEAINSDLDPEKPTVDVGIYFPSNLDAGFAANFTAQSETWGYFIDGNFVKLSADELGLKSGLDVEVDQKIVEAGISYRLSEQFNLIGGGRYQKVDEDINSPIGSLNDGDSWIDGFIGAVWQPVDTDKWTLRLRGDIGAGDSDSVWQAGIGGGYRFNKTWSILLAYRYLSTDFESEKFKWDVDQSGLGIGLGISW